MAQRKLSFSLRIPQVSPPHDGPDNGDNQEAQTEQNTRNNKQRTAENDGGPLRDGAEEAESLMETDGKETQDDQAQGSREDPEQARDGQSPLEQERQHPGPAQAREQEQHGRSPAEQPEEAEEGPQVRPPSPLLPNRQPEPGYTWLRPGILPAQDLPPPQAQEPSSPLHELVSLLQQTTMAGASISLPTASLPPSIVDRNKLPGVKLCSHGGDQVRQDTFPLNPELVAHMYSEMPFSTLLGADDFHPFSMIYQAYFSAKGVQWPPASPIQVASLSSFLQTGQIPTDFLFVPLFTNQRREQAPNLTEMCVHLSNLLSQAKGQVKGWVILPSYDPTITPHTCQVWDPRTAFLRLEKFLVSVDTIPTHFPLILQSQWDNLTVTLSPTPSATGLTILRVDSKAWWGYKPGKQSLSTFQGQTPSVTSLVQQIENVSPPPCAWLRVQVSRDFLLGTLTFGKQRGPPTLADVSASFQQMVSLPRK